MCSAINTHSHNSTDSNTRRGALQSLMSIYMILYYIIYCLVSCMVSFTCWTTRIVLHICQKQFPNNRAETTNWGRTSYFDYFYRSSRRFLICVCTVSDIHSTKRNNESGIMTMIHLPKYKSTYCSTMLWNTLSVTSVHYCYYWVKFAYRYCFTRQSVPPTNIIPLLKSP
jgi:hypothetical protein